MLCICKKLDILANEIKNPELKKYMDNRIAVSYTHLVQLGKVLAKRVLAHETDGALKVFSDLLNI